MGVLREEVEEGRDKLFGTRESSCVCVCVGGGGGGGGRGGGGMRGGLTTVGGFVQKSSASGGHGREERAGVSFVQPPFGGVGVLV